MRRIFLSACFVILAAGSAARAQEECDRSDDSQQMLNICADADYKAADAKLNKAYQDLIGGADDKTKTLLQTAQRAWIVFRDAECKYSASDSEGGSIYPMMVSECLTRLTSDRIKQLTASSNCQEGDASCASPDEGDVQ